MTAVAKSMSERLDPALRHLAGMRVNLSAEVLPVFRDSLNRRRRDEVRTVDITGVGIEETRAGSVPVRIYRGGSSQAPAVIYCHSGGFVVGNLDIDHRQCVELARRGQCTVISFDYRLAPEHPFPAAVDDATAVLEWAVDTASQLHIDAGRLAVAGSSAGGALAACLAQRHSSRIVFQMLHQPVLDDRPTPSKEEFDSSPGFDGPAVEAMWRHYLSGGEGKTDAAPARRTDLTGLPRALITCSELDPLRDEAIEYSLALLRAGVAAELHVFAGTCHGFDSFLPEWDTSRQLYALQGAALRRAFNNNHS
jgi:acetyl esterase/lipase